MTTSSGQSNSTTDAIVQQTAPAAAMEAGLIGVNSAGAAAAQDQTQIDNAIAGLNTQYNAAVSGLQPAEQSGVQALDQLNQYLGLNPYTPQAPVAPVNAGDATALASLDSQALSLMPQLNQINSLPANVAMGASPVPQNASSNNPGDPYSQIASVADQLESGGVPINGTVLGSGTSPSTTSAGATGAMNPADLSFLQAYGAAGGVIGGTGAELEQAMTAGPNQVYNSALQQYNTEEANYTQDMGWAQQYATPLTGSQIQANVEAQPGFQANLNQGLNAVQSQDTAKGYLGSGAILQDLMSYGQNQLSSYYGNMLSNLASEAGAGNSAAATQASAANSLGQSTASQYDTLGEAQANASLAAGNSLMNALISSNQQFSTMQTGSSSSSSSGSNLSGLGSALGALTQPSPTATAATVAAV